MEQQREKDFTMLEHCWMVKGTHWVSISIAFIVRTLLIKLFMLIYTNMGIYEVYMKRMCTIQWSKTPSVTIQHHCWVSIIQYDVYAITLIVNSWIFRWVLSIVFLFIKIITKHINFIYIWRDQKKIKENFDLQ